MEKFQRDARVRSWKRGNMRKKACTVQFVVVAAVVGFAAVAVVVVA